MPCHAMRTIESGLQQRRPCSGPFCNARSCDDWGRMLRGTGKAEQTHHPQCLAQRAIYGPLWYWQAHLEREIGVAMGPACRAKAWRMRGQPGQRAFHAEHDDGRSIRTVLQR